MMSSSRRIAVVGCAGQFGTDLVEVLAGTGRYTVDAVDHEQMDVADADGTRRVIAAGHYDVVINSAAFHQVDKCEDDPAEAMSVNAVGALNVARACAEVGALCVYVSTDYVFSGDKGEPYVESDEILPLNVYGVSKAAGEYLAKQTSRWLVVRISSVIGKAGARGKGGNFIEAILSRAKSGQSLQVVNDSWMSPTYTKDAAKAVDALLQRDATGTYHLSNRGRCTWHEFATLAVSLVGLKVPVLPVGSEMFPSKARRPRDSALDVSLLERTTGLAARPWQEALRDYLVEKGHIA